MNAPPPNDHSGQAGGGPRQGPYDARSQEVGDLVAGILSQAESAAQRITELSSEQAVTVLAVTDEVLGSLGRTLHELQRGRDDLAAALAAQAQPRSSTAGGPPPSPHGPTVVEEWADWPRR